MGMTKNGNAFVRVTIKISKKLKQCLVLAAAAREQERPRKVTLGEVVEELIEPLLKPDPDKAETPSSTKPGVKRGVKRGGA